VVARHASMTGVGKERKRRSSAACIDIEAKWVWNGGGAWWDNEDSYAGAGVGAGACWRFSCFSSRSRAFSRSLSNMVSAEFVGVRSGCFSGYAMVGVMIIEGPIYTSVGCLMYSLLKRESLLDNRLSELSPLDPPCSRTIEYQTTRLRL
jgi:hypothetical protein